MEENKWYVYKHIREDKNEPFYIGIGFVENYKRAYDSKGRSEFWNRISNKVLWHSEIIFDNLSEKEAKDKEIELIKFYGKIKNGGILCNITDGGDGTYGMRHTEETKLVIKEKRKNQIFTEETRKKLRNCQFGNRKALGSKHSEDIKKLKSINQRGKFGGEIIREDTNGNVVVFSGIKDAADSINKIYKDVWYYCKHSDLLYHGYYWKYNSKKQTKNKNIISKEYLYNEYVINKKSGQIIGNELNCSGNKIYRLLRKYKFMND